ncbi:PD-(D/E)XK nuclease family protein [Humibacter ginsengisoli]
MGLVSRPSHPSQAISPYWLIPACIVSAALGAYLAITLITANLADWGQWLREFAQSPGAAAIAALVAAVIAFTGISRQVAVSRASLDQQKKAAETNSWWAMFEWASDRAIPARHDGQPLPTSVTISTLERLAESATSSIQSAACAGVIDVVIKGIAATPTETPTDDIAPTEPDGPAFAALTSYVESSRGTPAASALAEALVYANNVEKALMSLTWNDATIKVFRTPSDVRADAIAEVDGRRVAIEIKFSRNSKNAHHLVARAVQQLRTRGGATDAYLVITPFDAALRPEEEAELRAVAAKWREPKDDSELLKALRRASELG